MRRRGPAAFALAVALLAAGCGIPLDDSPRAITANVTKPTTEQQTTSPGNSAVFLYFLKNDHLAGASRDVTDRRLESVLAAVLSGPTAEETSNGLISQIPAGTTVSSVTDDGQTVRIGISKELADVVGASRQEAIAQIVFTATELDGVSTVGFTVGGKALKVSSPTRGDVEQVSDCDFVVFLPTDDQVRDANLPADVTRHLAARRRALASRCPDSGN